MKNLTRRRVLRGMFNGTAVAVGLPLLNCFLNNNGTALASGAPLPQRFGTWSWGLGMSKSIFVPKKTGAWFYSAGTSGSRVPAANTDGQMVGALVVDPATTDAATIPGDRVLVITRWTPTGSPSNAGFQLNAFNGRSWPNSSASASTPRCDSAEKAISASEILISAPSPVACRRM